ncbi:MAG: MBL fold metallo-hydrolase [Alphaproteobacteria bacterium]|nr:MBL fold metallo-hydrolase [Alphaproteobacteria bacterium]
MRAVVRILGSGNSAGVPTIGNFWGACDPAEPRNRRTRPCVVVQSETTTLAVDTGPDFKHQMNGANIDRVDAVFFTHAHSDHIMGIDELRILSHRQKHLIPVYANEATLESLQRSFPYLFTESASGLYHAVLDAECIRPADYGIREFRTGDLNFKVFQQDHGTCETLGLRIGDTAYSPDMIHLDDDAIRVLDGISNWIVDAAGYKSETNPVHANLDKIFFLNERIGAKRVILAHLTPSMDYATMKSELPDGYEPAWDGLEVVVTS